MIHASRPVRALLSGFLLLFLAASCATVTDTTKKGVQKAGELVGSAVESAVELTKTTIVTIGELSIELIEKPIDYVRGNLLYGKRDAGGRTVLHYAVAEKNVEELTRLLDEGAPRLYDNEGHEPYHLAVLQNDPEFLRVFATYRQELDKPTKNGVPPLHLAAGADAAETFNWLLMAGLDPLQPDPNGLDALRHGMAKNRSNFLSRTHNYVDHEATDTSGDSYIHFATRYRNSGAINQLIQLGIPADQPNDGGETALMLAVTQPRSNEVIQVLIDEGANIEKVDASGDTPVIRSIRANLPANLEILLNAGANPNTPDAQGRTPVFISVPTNNGDHIQHLARFGVALDQYDAEGLSPIHRAVAGNHPRVIEPLVQSGAQVDYPVKDKGATALMLAARIGLSKIQGNLQRLGASNLARDIAGNTALHYAAAFDRGKNVSVALAGRAGKKADPSADHGKADINAQNARGETATHSAVYRTASSALSALLKGAPDLTLRDLKGNQPLHAALHTGNLNFARSLLKKNAPVDSPNAEGATPLVSSIRDNNLEMVDLLVNNKKNKASLVLTDDNGRYPLHEAALHNRPEIAIQLARAESPVNPLDNNGHTPLHLAAARGHHVSVRALLRNGAFINARDPGLNTPLHLATAADKPNAVQELMRSGADASLRNIQLKAPLFTALDADSLDSFAPILRDSYPNIRDPMGNTALMTALKQEKYEAAMRLLKLGVAPQYGNSLGQTPLHLAYELQNTRLIGELANAGADLNTPLKPHGYDLCEAHRARQNADNPNPDSPDSPDSLDSRDSMDSPNNQEATQDNQAEETVVVQLADTSSQHTAAPRVVPTAIGIAPVNIDDEASVELEEHKLEDQVETSQPLPEPGPLEDWRADCLLFLNDADYLSKRARWLLLGHTKSYVASRWWQRIPLSPRQDANTIARITTDAQAKLAYYLSYSLPDTYLPPLTPPEAPRYAAIERQSNESRAAYLERLDYYQREYQDRHQRQVGDYLARKENRLERIAQMKGFHQELDIQPKRPAISLIADSLQYHYNRPLRASNAAMDTVNNRFIIELPISGDERTLLIKVSEITHPDHFAYLKREWRQLPWYLGALVTPDSFTFVEAATFTPEGMLFIPLNADVPGSQKVLVNKFNQF